MRDNVSWNNDNKISEVTDSMRSDEKKNRRTRTSGSKEKSAIPAVSVVMYILSAIMLIAALFMLYYGIQSVTQYIQSYGLSLSDVKLDVIQTVASSCLPYIAYAAILFGVGKAVSAAKKAVSAAAAKTAGNVPEYAIPEDSIAAAAKTSEEKTALPEAEADDEDSSDDEAEETDK